MIRCVALAAASFWCLVSSAYGQDKPSGLQLASVIAGMMHKDNISGGIVETSSCSVAPSAPPAIGNAGVDEYLSKLRRRSRITLTKVGYPVAYLIQIGHSAENTFMNLAVPETTLRPGSLPFQSSLLFDLAEVVKHLSQDNVILFDRGQGITSLPESSENSIPTAIKAGSLAKGLNVLASRKPGSVWLYRQVNCGGRRTATFAWLYR